MYIVTCAVCHLFVMGWGGGRLPVCSDAWPGLRVQKWRGLPMAELTVSGAIYGNAWGGPIVGGPWCLAVSPLFWWRPCKWVITALYTDVLARDPARHTPRGTQKYVKAGARCSSCTPEGYTRHYLERAGLASYFYVDSIQTFFSTIHGSGVLCTTCSMYIIDLRNDRQDTIAINVREKFTNSSIYLAIEDIINAVTVG